MRLGNDIMYELHYIYSSLEVQFIIPLLTIVVEIDAAMPCDSRQTQENTRTTARRARVSAQPQRSVKRSRIPSQFAGGSGGSSSVRGSAFAGGLWIMLAKSKQQWIWISQVTLPASWRERRGHESVVDAARKPCSHLQWESMPFICIWIAEHKPGYVFVDQIGKL